jgi:hypothetical protein
MARLWFNLEAKGMPIKLIIGNLEEDGVSFGLSLELWLNFFIRVGNQSEIKAIRVPRVRCVITMTLENMNLSWCIN